MLRDALFSISLSFGGTPVPPPVHYQPIHRLPPPPVLMNRHHGPHFDVMYRTCIHEGWRWAGSFDGRYSAEYVARKLSRRGYDVRIRSH